MICVRSTEKAVRGVSSFFQLKNDTSGFKLVETEGQGVKSHVFTCPQNCSIYYIYVLVTG